MGEMGWAGIGRMLHLLVPIVFSVIRERTFQVQRLTNTMLHLTVWKAFYFHSAVEYFAYPNNLMQITLNTSTLSSFANCVRVEDRGEIYCRNACFWPD